MPSGYEGVRGWRRKGGVFMVSGIDLGVGTETQLDGIYLDGGLE